jgi:hypothetical protein
MVERLAEGNRLHRLAEAHLVGEARRGPATEAVKQPVEALELVGEELTPEERWRACEGATITIRCFCAQANPWCCSFY